MIALCSLSLSHTLHQSITNTLSVSLCPSLSGDLDIDETVNAELLSTGEFEIMSEQVCVCVCVCVCLCVRVRVRV